MSSYREAIRKRLAEATPGPWQIEEAGCECCHDTRIVLPCKTNRLNDRWICRVYAHTESAGNDFFIAHARTDVATLLALLEKAEAALFKGCDCRETCGDAILFCGACEAFSEIRATLDAPETNYSVIPNSSKEGT